MPIRLVLADDHPIVLQGLVQLFRSASDFDVVVTCSTGRDALEAVRREKPDVLVLDLRMPNMGGLEVLRALADENISCRVVLLTAELQSDEAAEALALGAGGLVLKETATETLLECVRRVHRGLLWIDSETATGALSSVLRRESATRKALSILTPREIEIVRLVAQGLRNKDIAARLTISEGTVKLHLHHIYEKTDVDGRLELVLYAQNQGLVASRPDP